MEHIFIELNEGKGRSDFLEHKVMRQSILGFLPNEWLTLTVDIMLTDQQRIVHRQPEPALECRDTADQQRIIHRPPQPALQCRDAADEQLCVICMDQMKTSGVLHGETYMTIF